MEIKVSIVMPVKNTAGYIRECMESLLSQTMEEIEILCVDAGSTDGTQEILQEYADRDSRVRLLEDTKGSTGYANNLGMEKASGEYVAIMEPDDFAAPDMYEKLYEAAVKNHADAVRADYQVFFGEKEKREYIDKAVAVREDYGKVYCPADEQRLFRNDMSTWAGIYARKLFTEEHMCHNETPGAAYQDNGFWFLMMAHVKRLCYIPVSGYRYRMDNPGSSIHKRGKIFAICDEYEFIRERLASEGIFEKFECIYVWAKFIRYLSAYHRLDDALKGEFAGRFAREMQEHFEKEEPERRALYSNFSKGQKKLLNELLQGGERFHNCRMEEKKVFHALMQRDSGLVQYGCGSDGLRLLLYMREMGCLDRLKCLCDGNPGLWGNEVFGKKICSPDETREIYPDASYLVASINYGDEIRERLRVNGIREERIYKMNFC